jgi:hypothetical protein
MEGLTVENAGLFYGHLEYFTVIWDISWPFDNGVVIWYIFPRFGILCQEKSGNPDSDMCGRSRQTQNDMTKEKLKLD